MALNLKLRAIENEDLEAIYNWENDEDAWDYSDTIAPISRKQIAAYIETYTADPFNTGQLRMMIEKDEDRIGLADLYKIEALHAHAFIGLYIDLRYRKKGFGCASIEVLCNYAFNRLGLKSLCAMVLTDNIASQALFNKAHFVKIGVLPSWHRIGLNFKDVIMYMKTSQV